MIAFERDIKHILILHWTPFSHFTNNNLVTKIGDRKKSFTDKCRYLAKCLRSLAN